ncbi:MAG TPA: glucose-6-phosphate isomerase [Solirubrobacter sp.]|nr:glucose-6-phosphate isomerase [Solirubrobacter sp.]
MTASTLVDFDLTTGLSATRRPIERRLSAMAGMFADTEAYEALLEDDPLVYVFYDMEVPDAETDVAYGTSITYPGKVGDEYFMTKGHFHSVIDTAEVYYCLSGRGYMLMENPEGDVEAQELTPGKAVYVPGRYAHRSVNTGGDPLITFFAFPGHAGHDYATIETQGFRKLIVERDGEPVLVDNPRWSQ